VVPPLLIDGLAGNEYENVHAGKPIRFPLWAPFCGEVISQNSAALILYLNFISAQLASDFISYNNIAQPILYYLDDRRGFLPMPYRLRINDQGAFRPHPHLYCTTTADEFCRY
jgi:hypothetical protein